MWFSFFGHRPRHAALGELNTDKCTLAKQGAAYTVDLDRHVITTTNLPNRDRFILAAFIWENGDLVDAELHEKILSEECAWKVV